MKRDNNLIIAIYFEVNSANDLNCLRIHHFYCQVNLQFQEFDINFIYKNNKFKHPQLPTVG